MVDFPTVVKEALDVFGDLFGTENRCLTEAEWDVTALNDRRLAWLQRAPQTRYSPRGVIAITNTLVTHEGKLIEDVGWF